MLTPHSLENINVSSPVGPIRNNTEKRVKADPTSKKLCFKEGLKEVTSFAKWKKCRWAFVPVTSQTCGCPKGMSCVSFFCSSCRGHKIFDQMDTTKKKRQSCVLMGDSAACPCTPRLAFFNFTIHRLGSI